MGATTYGVWVKAVAGGLLNERLVVSATGSGPAKVVPNYNKH